MGWLDQLSEHEQQACPGADATSTVQPTQKAWEREAMAKRDAWIDSIRPQFDALAARFTRIFDRSEAFTIWRSMLAQGIAPTADDVPDGNTTDLIMFLLKYRNRRAAQESVQNAGRQNPMRDLRTMLHDGTVLDQLRCNPFPIPLPNKKSNHVAA